MPVVRSIYKSAKQIFETAVFPRSARHLFRKVGMISTRAKAGGPCAHLYAAGAIFAGHLKQEKQFVFFFLRVCCYSS